MSWKWMGNKWKEWWWRKEEREGKWKFGRRKRQKDGNVKIEYEKMRKKNRELKRKKNERKRIECRKSWRKGVEGHTEDCWSGEKRKSSGIEKGCSSSFPLSLSLYSVCLSFFSGESTHQRERDKGRKRGCKDTGGQFGGKLQKDNVQKFPLIFLLSLFFLYNFGWKFRVSVSCRRRIPGIFVTPSPSLFLQFLSFSAPLRKEKERKRGSINPDRGQLTCSVNLFTMLQVHVIPFQGFFTCFKLPLPHTPKYSQFPYALER